MDPGITIEFAVAGIVILVSLVVGWRAHRAMGAFLLSVGALLASIITIGLTFAGLSLGKDVGGWLGLVTGILVTGGLAWLVGNAVLRSDGGRFATALWFGLCVFSLAGYLAGGWIGLLTVTLPAIGVFWIALFRVSAYILPLRDEHQRPELRFRQGPSQTGRPQAFILPLRGLSARLRDYFNFVRGSQWPQAFRSLLTFTMGANYPYYVIRDGEVELRVGGNPFRMFFAGPGIVYVDCDQAGYLTDGLRVKDILEPGLNFTGFLDREPKAIDLRTQLCSFPTKAVTKDGIRVRVVIHVAFRVHPGSQTGAPSQQASAQLGPQLGHSFPLDAQSLRRVAAIEPVRRRVTETAPEVRHQWDTEYVPMLAIRAFQDVVSQYDLDDLCAPLQPSQQPFCDVVNHLSGELRQTLASLSIELVEAWLDNLEPVDQEVTKRRLDNWRTEWERRILTLMGEGRAERTREIEKARAQAELRILLRFGQIAAASPATDSASEAALALRFIDCLGEMVSESDSQWPLPESSRETLRHLRGEIEEGRR